MLVPLLLLQLVLMIVALRHLIKHREEVRGPVFLWVLVIVFGQLWGPIVYLIFGRERQ